MEWKAAFSYFFAFGVAHSGEADVVVVDNNSSDDSVKFLQESYPEIRLVHNPENGGFAKGYNQGLEQIKGEYSYYVLLNSDVEVTENWIAPILTLMQSDEAIAACQPKVLAYKSKNNFEHAGASGGFIDKNGYPFCRGRIFDKTEEDNGQYDQSQEIFWATGACMFVKSEVFHELGGFDETYFAHMEEIDLCWRMKLHGHKIMVEPISSVFHLGGGTLDYMSPRKVYLNFRNSLFTLYKNYRGKFLFFKMTFRFALDYLAFFVFLLKGEWKGAKEILKAQKDFFGHLGEMKEKRTYILQQTKGKKMNQAGMYSKSIVFGSFVKGITKYSDLDSRNFYS